LLCNYTAFSFVGTSKLFQQPNEDNLSSTHAELPLFSKMQIRLVLLQSPAKQQELEDNDRLEIRCCQSKQGGALLPSYDTRDAPHMVEEPKLERSQSVFSRRNDSKPS
jgi:hypothetical protein